MTQKLTNLTIQYAALRDAMYRASRAADDTALDRAILKFRVLSDQLWATGHELMIAQEKAAVWEPPADNDATPTAKGAFQ